MTTASRMQETLEASIAASASKMTGVGSGVTILSWLTSSAVGMWLGILIGVLGLVINWYFKHRSDRRAQEIHTAYMKKIMKGDGKVFIDLDEDRK